MSDDWLDQLHQLHEADKAKRQAEVEQAQEIQTQQDLAGELLRQSKALELLRQVQKVLLGGKGQLDIAAHTDRYDKAIALIWQGPISAARKPDSVDLADYYYILVGVRQGKLWVNGKPIPTATPEALKAALLTASKNPKRQKRG